MTGVRVAKMRLGMPDASGRQSVEASRRQHVTLEADLVIKALGFDPEKRARACGACLKAWR